MTPTPKGWRGLFIACLIAHAIGQRLRTRDIVDWIDEKHPYAIERKQRRSKRNLSRKQVKGDLLKEINLNFQRRWQSDYPAVQQEPGDSDGEWCYHLTEKVALLGSDIEHHATDSPIEKKLYQRVVECLKTEFEREKEEAEFERVAEETEFDHEETESRQTFTSHDIAKWIVANHPDYAREKGASSKQVIPVVNQIAAEINIYVRRPIEEHHTEVKIEFRPEENKYLFSYLGTKAADAKTEGAKTSNAEAAGAKTEGEKTADAEATSATRESIPLEYNLYPSLAEFLWLSHRIRNLRIDEKDSSARSEGEGYNEWVHPDFVGMEFLEEKWTSKIRTAATAMGTRKARLWSFEVKNILSRGNVRKSFFQAVSNSSWANFGYLVTREINGADTEEELQILSRLHGIGVIHLNHEDPSGGSRIWLPAREREEVDWSVANRLSELGNQNFCRFLTEVVAILNGESNTDLHWTRPTDDETKESEGQKNNCGGGRRKRA